MTILVKLAYAAAVAALMVLLVAFGVRAFYAAPEPPEYPQPPLSRPPIVTPVAPGAGIATPTAGWSAVIPPTPDDLARYEAEQREYQRAYERYEEKRLDYRRNVLIVSSALAIVAIAGGAASWSRVDAMSLGFTAGGFATLLYGVIQAGSDLDEISPALIFTVALVGLLAVLGAGYRWLSQNPRT